MDMLYGENIKLPQNNQTAKDIVTFIYMNFSFVFEIHNA